MAPTSTANSLEHILSYPTASPYRSSNREPPVTKSCIVKRRLPERRPLYFNVSQHPRTTSEPCPLLSHQQQDENQSRLSMDVLLDAIDLDLQMRNNFKAEWLKTQHSRYASNAAKMVMMSRRRSRSAPSAPPSYYCNQKRSFDSVWIAPSCNNRVVTTATDAQELAQCIVKQHLQKSSIAKKRPM